MSKNNFKPEYDDYLDDWLDNIVEPQIVKETELQINYFFESLRTGNTCDNIEKSIELIKKQTRDWMTGKCDCKSNDVRGRCQPNEFSFFNCEMKIDTAVWFIEKNYLDYNYFKFLGEIDYNEIEYILSNQ
jgi:hypothetical protein